MLGWAELGTLLPGHGHTQAMLRSKSTDVMATKRKLHTAVIERERQKKVNELRKLLRSTAVCGGGSVCKAPRCTQTYASACS